MAANASPSNGPGSDAAPFAEHHLIDSAIRSLTVKNLKALIGDINKNLFRDHHYLRLSGNKPELVNRVVNALAEKRAAKDARGYQAFRNLVVQNGGYIPPTSAGRPVNNHAGPGGANTVSKLGASSPYSGFSSAAASTSTPTVTARSMAGASAHNRINFKPSPFYEIRQFLSNMVICPEAPTSTDRKNASVYVSFTREQLALLKDTDTTHQVRLFCTTHEAYAVALSGRFPASVEFPLTCEARVNGYPLSINLRGSKKNAGRVPPPNLNKDKQLFLQPQRQNRIELTYTNCQKKHALIVALCEVTSADALVGKLRKKQYRSKEEVISSMRKAAEDDDIQAGSATMSLKCPLSYMRMVTPCRSTHCPHVQCFDALSFYSINEQSPSWSCPVCNQTIRPDDLLMDGYVYDILQRVPDEHDSVVVEPDGSWKTSDGKITSDGTTVPTSTANPGQVEQPETKPWTGDSVDIKAPLQSRAPIISENIVILDSPSPPARITTPSSSSAATAAAPMAQSTPSAAATAASAAAASSSRQSSARPAPAPTVIDLTLSDSDDDATAPPPSRSRARPIPPQNPLAHSKQNGASPNSLASSAGVVPRRTSNGHVHHSTAGDVGSRGARTARSIARERGYEIGRNGERLAYLPTDEEMLAPRQGPDGRRDEGKTPSDDDDSVRRPGKRARLEASQGNGATGAGGGGGMQRAAGNGIVEDDSPSPAGRGGGGSGGGGGSRSSSTTRYSMPVQGGRSDSVPAISGSRRLLNRIRAGAAASTGAPLRSNNGSSYPTSYLDTDIGDDSFGSMDSAGGGKGEGEGRREMSTATTRNMEWRDENDPSRSRTGGRNQYFEDDEWW